MKKKIALLLAMVMTLSLSMSAFAASTNRFYRTPSVVPDQTLIPEGTAQYEKFVNGKYSDSVQVGSETAVRSYKPTKNIGDVDWVVEGNDLIIELKDDVRVGEEFAIRIENADWFFRNTTDGSGNVIDSNDSDAVKSLSDAITYNSESEGYVNSSRINTSDYGVVNYEADAITEYRLYATFDTSIGTWNSTTNTYKRTNSNYRNDPDIEDIDYELSFNSANAKRGVVKITEPASAVSSYDYSSGKRKYIVIPLVVLTTEETDVRVIIEEGLPSVTPGTYIFGQAGGGATTNSVDDPLTARDSFLLNRIDFKENRINTIKNGTFEIYAPSGFRFANPNDSAVKLSLDYGLSWTSKSTGLMDGDGVRGSGTGNSYVANDWDINYKTFNYYGTEYNEESTLVVRLSNIRPSNTVRGTLSIHNLRIIAEDNAPFGEFQIYASDDCGMSETKFKAGNRQEWDLTLKSISTVPTLVNGRYEREDMRTAVDAHHRTADVEFQENSVAAWWANRQTVFELPEGVKFRKVELYDTDNLASGFGGRLEKTYINNGVRDDLVTIDGSTMTWGSMNIEAGKRARVRMRIWVSIESGFGDDGEEVVLTATGSAIPEQTAGGDPSCVIAKVQSPVTVETKVTDVKIGYQYQPTADITIKENLAGYLLKGKQVRLSVTDMISTDMYLTPDTKAVVEDGSDLRISNVTTGMSGTAGYAGILYGYSVSGQAMYSSQYTLPQLGQGGTLTFDITQASSTAKGPGTITISNVAVKVDRTAPETNDRAIKIVVWGTAIANNYGSARDMFQTPGISKDYINNISSANDKSGILTAVVDVYEGESYYTKNGEDIEMDAEAFVSTDYNSMMVPVRFVSEALGIDKDAVIWDNVNKTVTIMAPNKVIQFTANSTEMIVNGVAVTMATGSQVVAPVISGEAGHERMYIPFRHLGEAFGIPVGWDPDTRTATYN